MAAKVDQRTAQWIADTERTKEPDDSDAATQIFIAKIKLKTLYEVALGKRGLLHADFDLIVAEDGQWVSATVREVLADPQRFNERETLDPLEPDYDGGRAVGWLNLNADPPELFSQAHGGQRFELVGDPPVEVQGAKDHPRGRVPASTSPGWNSNRSRGHRAGLAEDRPLRSGRREARRTVGGGLVASAVKNEMGGDVAAWGGPCLRRRPRHCRCLGDRKPTTEGPGAIQARNPPRPAPEAGRAWYRLAA